MDQLGKKLSQYVITLILIAFGILFLAKYISGDEIESQPVTMLYAALFLILVGVLAAPPVMAKFSVSLVKILGFLGIAIGAFLAYQVWYSVDEEIEFQAERDRINAVVIQRLKDIREAQEAYAEFNGKYTSNFDSLIAWIQQPVLAIPFRMGTFHDTLNEERSVELGYVIDRNGIDSVAQVLGRDVASFTADINENRTAYKVIDTVYTSFYAENFAPEQRRAKKLPEVSLDSLPFSPLRGERFFIRTGTVDKAGLKLPTILVQDPTPFGRDKVKKDTLRFGSLDEPITDGNWK
jgi:hypothetical protein